MGVFDGLGKAEYFEGGKYVSPGVFLVEVKRVKQGLTRKKEPFFVVEMKTIESSSLKEHPLGTDMSWMVMLKHDAALGNIKHFLSVASGSPLTEVDEKDAEEAVAEANPLAGVKLRISAVNVKTRAGADFTKVKFMSAETSAADAAAEHAKETAKDAAPAAAAAPAPAQA